MFSHMGQIWCQFFCDFMKISRFENVLFVCLNFCVSLRITCKGVENESFQEFSIISQKLKACSTCSKNPPDGPPPYPGSKWTVYVAFFIFHMREHKERGGQPAPKCRVFSNFYVIFSNILPLLFCCVFAFFSVLKLIFKIFFDRFSGNFRLSRQDEGVFSHLSKKKIKNSLIRPRNDFSKIAIFSPFSFKETKGNLFRS